MLPSQFTRPKASRAHMYRRGRRRRLPLAIAAATVLLGSGAAITWWPRSDSTASAGTTADPGKEHAAPDASRQARSPAPTDQQTSPSPKPAEKITMGGGGPKVTIEPPTPLTSTTLLETKAASTPPAANAPADKPAAAGDAKPAENKPVDKPVDKPANKPIAPPSVSNAGSVSSSSSNSVAGGNKSGGSPTSGSPASGSPTLGGGEPPIGPGALVPRASQRVQAGLDLIAQNKPVDARRMLTLALASPGVSAAEGERIRLELEKLNQRLVFGPEIVPGDPFAGSYTVEGGDSLAKLPRKLGLKTEYLFIKRINNIKDERRLRVGQRLKTINGVFHAVVDKRDFRLDLYLAEAPAPGSASDPAKRVLVRSFPVGTGEFNATPEGVFVVKADSKLINPAWANPRTGESFGADDPKNPLGEYWIGLVGESENIRGLEGYGIHGTIEPESIGQMKSMGCIRMLHDDVALVYEVLMPGVSTVTIRGDEYP